MREAVLHPEVRCEGGLALAAAMRSGWRWATSLCQSLPTQTSIARRAIRQASVKSGCVGSPQIARMNCDVPVQKSVFSGVEQDSGVVRPLCCTGQPIVFDNEMLFCLSSKRIT